MDRLGLEETIAGRGAVWYREVVKVVKTSGLRWMGHVMRKKNDEPVKRA